MRALKKSFGQELMVAGLFKFLWSVFVITGAFYFIRSILLYVDRDVQSPYDSDTAGFSLMAAFFVDAWLLGRLHTLVGCVLCWFSRLTGSHTKPVFSVRQVVL